jgi:hypothetical protein
MAVTANVQKQKTLTASTKATKQPPRGFKSHAQGYPYPSHQKRARGVKNTARPFVARVPGAGRPRPAAIAQRFSTSIRYAIALFHIR